MKIDNRISSLIAMALTASTVSIGRAQMAMNGQPLSVPERCALKIVEEPVAHKLKLTATQSAVYNHAVTAYIAESKKLDEQKNPKEIDRIACDKKFANACLNTLTPQQKHQVLQIGIPEIGIFALTDASISTQIGLTPIQIKKVRSICQAFAKRDEDVSAMIANALAAIPEPKPGADRTAYEKKRLSVAGMYNGEQQRIAREKAAAEAQVLKVMTPPQKAKWLDLAAPAAKK